MIVCTHNCRIVPGLLALALALWAPASALAAGEVELAEGLWVSEKESRVYLSNPQGLPEARELAGGGLLWTGAEPAVLLLPIEGRWLAMGQSGKRGVGRLLMLDAASGAVQQHFDVPLPEAVSAAVLAEPLRRFEARAEEEGGRILLHWSYVAHPMRGALLVSDAGAVAGDGLQLQGVLELGLRSPSPTSRARLDIEPRPQARAPDLRGEARVTDLGERQFRSANDRHAMAPEPVADDSFGTVWRWRFASRGEGALAHTLDLPYGYAPFLLSGTRLLHQAPPLSLRLPGGTWQHAGLRLQVYDLDEGRELWSAELLDREFRGALPP